MIARELTTIATTTSSNNSKKENVRLTIATGFKTTSRIKIIARRPNVPVGLLRAELARELHIVHLFLNLLFQVCPYYLIADVLGFCAQ